VSTATEPVRVKRTRPKDRRDQILKEAFRLIAASGFNAVSLADIAQASGIQKSSVLHHFGSMHELLFGVLALREEENYGFYLEAPGPEVALDPRSARERFTRVFHHNLERPEFVRLYAMLSAESVAANHPAHEYFADRARLARSEMARSLTWKPDSELAAAEFLAFWEGLESALSHDPELDVRTIWENYCDRFFV
jgi:AcrR family transcriptional regulator